MNDQLIRDTVSEFVSKGYMFTAYDVTKTIRKSGVSLHHSEVNGIVKAMWLSNELGIYQREVVDIGTPCAPLLYYHPHSDIENYDSSWVDSNPTQNGMIVSAIPAASTASTPTPADATDKSDTKDATDAGSPLTFASQIPVGSTGNPLFLRVTKEKRFQIPISMVKSVGWTPSQKIAILEVSDWTTNSNDKQLMLTPYRQSYGPLNCKTVVVNEDGRVRISQKKHLGKLQPSNYDTSTCRAELNTVKNSILIRL